MRKFQERMLSGDAPDADEIKQMLINEHIVGSFSEKYGEAMQHSKQLAKIMGFEKSETVLTTGDYTSKLPDIFGMKRN
jgi:hypothetical protein